MEQHALERTSPKGQPFIGTCRKCGREGLTFKDMANDECPNVRNMTDSEVLLEALGSKEKLS